MKIGEWLDDVSQTIQTKRAALDLLPGTRNFEGCFHSSVENSACCVAIEVKRRVYPAQENLGSADRYSE